MSFTENYLDLMLCVLAADGKYDEKEKELFRELIENASVEQELKEKYQTILNNEGSFELEPFLSGLTLSGAIEPSGLAAMIRDAYLMASIDGDVNNSEKNVINMFLKNLGVPEERLNDIKNWAIDSIELFKKGEELFQVQ